MFDMKKNAADDTGYQIRITYIAELDMYFVTGLIMREGSWHDQHEYEQDGAALKFHTMDEAMAYIREAS